MRKLFEISVILILGLVASCSSSEEAADSHGLRILVSIVPQQYFVQRIAGESADISVLIPPGANPASWELSPSDMRRVSNSDIWFSIGVLSENNWYEDFQEINPDLVIINTVENIERLPIDRYGIPGEQNPSDHDHSHEGSMDPHVWLSPELVKSQISLIAMALVEMDPENAAVYMGNLEEFEDDISLLQDRLHLLLDSYEGSCFMVFHPAWGYFADEFGLVQVPIEIAGSEPSPGEMSAIVDHGMENHVQIVFVSPQFSSSSAETIAEELDASVVAIDPLAENWLSNMETVAGELQGALR